MTIGYSCHQWQQHAAAPPPHRTSLSPARQWLIGGSLALALAGLFARLAYWQIGWHTTLTQRANAQHLSLLTLPSGRGMILDRNGTILALTVTDDVGSSLSQREEPSGILASQILGYVQKDTGVGKYGIEQQFDGLLAGQIGQYATTVDVTDTNKQAIMPAIPGADITLTLDANIQYMAQQGLQQALAQTGAPSGTVIIADPQTGAILAMANAPDFDPNHYNQAPLAAFQNPAISNMYDPGSTMKAITLAMGIDAGVITPTTTIDDPGYFVAGGQPIYNWNHLAWGTETMTQVLAHSANAGAAWVAVAQLGSDRFTRYLHTFGFGAATQIALPSEATGLLASPEGNNDLTQLDLAENAFGESISVTPLQMVMAYSVLANGGKLMQPQIVKTITYHGQTQENKPIVVRQVISQQSAAAMTSMLRDAGQHGDAQTGLIQGYTVAAKTGTSTPDPSDPSHTFASVLGYAPAAHPRFVVLVKLDYPQTSVFGGEAAGPLWRALVRQLMAYAQIPAEGA